MTQCENMGAGSIHYAKTLPRVNFILPGRNASGGVRVTARMAMLLRTRGVDCRVLYRQSTRPRWYRRILDKSSQSVDWLAELGEHAIAYMNLSKDFDLSNEIVIAVGSHTVAEVRRLESPAFKLKYCHGFSEHLETLNEDAWSCSMPAIAVSETLLSKLNEMGTKNILGVVPNGIELEDYGVDVDFASPARNAVGTVYNANPKKDPRSIIQVCDLLKRELGFRVVAFGAQRKPSTLSCDQYVRCASPRQARSIYNECRVWFVASRSEGFCLPIVEAMACGAAIVSTDHDTVRGLIGPGINGDLVPVGDAGALANAIVRLHRDHRRACQYSRAGRETAEHFSWQRAVDQMINVLQLAGPSFAKPIGENN